MYHLESKKKTPTISSIIFSVILYNYINFHKNIWRQHATKKDIFIQKQITKKKKNAYILYAGDAVKRSCCVLRSDGLRICLGRVVRVNSHGCPRMSVEVVHQRLAIFRSSSKSRCGWYDGITHTHCGPARTSRMIVTSVTKSVYGIHTYV